MLRLEETSSVLCFLLLNDAWSAVFELPVGARTVGAGQVALAEGGIDAVADLDFVAGFSGEQNVQP